MNTFAELRETIELLKRNNIYPIRNQHSWSHRIVQESPFTGTKVGSLTFVSNKKILKNDMPLYELIKKIKDKSEHSLHEKFLKETGILDTVGTMGLDFITAQWINDLPTVLQPDYSYTFHNVTVPPDREAALWDMERKLVRIKTPSNHFLRVTVRRITKTKRGSHDLELVFLPFNFNAGTMLVENKYVIQ